VGLKQEPQRGDGQDDDGLNRTSVGLKPLIAKSAESVKTRPQSNQRGIETEKFRSSATASEKPQSNQRGIETKQSGQNFAPNSPGPQSNQRGIETTKGRPSAGLPLWGLNRTSVGLKLRWWVLILLVGLSPQSNQRGIETSQNDSISYASV